MMNNSNVEASISRWALALQIAFALLVPAVFVIVGTLGQLNFYDRPSSEFPYWLFIGIGALVLLALTPFALSLKHVSLRKNQILIESLFSRRRTIPIHEVYSVDVSYPAPMIATLQLFDCSKIRYIPKMAGLFDVGAPTQRLIAHAESNRQNAG